MNNFRVMMPSGRVCSVNEVRPITEKVVSFNGSKHRFLEVVKNLNDDTNGISIIRAYEDNMFEGVFRNCRKITTQTSKPFMMYDHP